MQASNSRVFFLNHDSSFVSNGRELLWKRSALFSRKTDCRPPAFFMDFKCR